MVLRGVKSYLMSLVLIAGMLVNPLSAMGAESEAAADNAQEWKFAVFGTSTNADDNGYEEEEDSVRVYSLNGKGKIVPKSTDGIAYYYTALPTDTNFTLTASGHINDWFFSNGQEGFGVMAADRVGEGNSAFWNNSFAAAVTGYSYVADSGNKINMKIGVSAIERYGVNNDNLYYFDQQDAETIASYFNTKQSPLESYCSTMEAGNYNIAGNSVEASHTFDAAKKGVEDYTALKLDTTVKEITDFTLTIQKNNSGYFMSYTDENGKDITKKSFVLGDDPLTALDSDNIYVGLFAARNMDVTFDDIKLTLINPAEDAAPETPENTYITLDEGIRNAAYTNHADNDLMYYSNWDGNLKVVDDKDTTVYEGEVKSDEYVVMPVSLTEGKNVFTTYFTPDEDFHYGYDDNHLINLYNVLDSYDEVKQETEIEYSSYAEIGDTIYVSPDGSAEGDGSEANPYDINTAIKFVQPGQTIVLAGGRYEFEDDLKIVRGIDGEAEQPITLMAAPDAAERPVFDFMKTAKGFTAGGNYWVIKGIDVTGSADGQKGFCVAGSYCTIEDVNTYYNGNTGLQVARYWGYDSKDSGMWPHDVLIKNCTSYDNSDSGFEDADGFAAKLTVGDNIVFDGCISHHNADDGWDLFAKSELGQIGSVQIKNCVAYMNGYIHIKDREDIVAAKLRGEFTQQEGFISDEAGSLVDAGNGNGFKLGGEGLKGGHELIGCMSFMNKANGITSNSCPDIKVNDTVSYDNGGSNLALYTGDKVENTDFAASGVITYRKYTSVEKEENINCKGSQDNSVIFTADNYIYNVENSVCENSEGEQITDENFAKLEFDPEQETVARAEDGTIDMGDFLKLSMDSDDTEAEKTAAENSSENESTSAQEAPKSSGFAGFIESIAAFFRNLFK